MSTKARLIVSTILCLFIIPFLCAHDITRTEVQAAIKNSERRINDSIIKANQSQDEIIAKIQSRNKVLSDSIIQVQSNLSELIVKVDKIRTSTTDRLWILIAAALVFFMQAGFAALESGLVRSQHVPGVAMKNLIDWVIVSLAFTLIGFAIMFGENQGTLGITGVPSFSILDVSTWSKTHHKLGLEFFIFQLAFASTAATIVSGALAERQYFFAYVLTSFLMGLVIYPIFGHWAWSGSHLKGNQGWLEQKGFIDFAGSTVVHSIGGWVSLAGIIVLKARSGRFKSEGVNDSFKPANFGLAVLGVFILWFGWWGFNGGSILAMNSHVIVTIVNTNIAGAVAGFTSFIFSYIYDMKRNKRRDTLSKTLGGVLGGLVAVTASCNKIEIWQAALVGLVAGFVHNIAYDAMLKYKLDDPVGAVPVHLACGIWGTLFVGIVGISSIGVQILGIFVAFIFAFSIAFAFFKLLDVANNLRISPEEERRGDTLSTGQFMS